jgi:hypothetical protein
MSTGTATGIRLARGMTGCSSSVMRGRRPCPAPSRKDGAREAAPISGTARAHLADQDTPAPADELADLLHAAFRELVGTDLASDLATPVQRDQYARSGMPSGMISPDTWLSVLLEEVRTRRPESSPGVPGRGPGSGAGSS